MLNPLAHVQRVLRRRSHYRRAFESLSGQQVLADLKRFCRAGESPLVVGAMSQQTDAMATGVQIGRQEVFQRIAHMLNIDDAHLINLKEDNE